MATPWSFIIRLILVISTVTVSLGQNNSRMKMFAEWKDIEYNFPNPYQRDAALANRIYVNGNSLPIDVDVDFKDFYNPPRVFVTIPRFQLGIPVTLGYVTPYTDIGGPRIQPYPDYTWHWSNGTDCNGITSVVRIAIDKCNRLWVLDTGKIGETQTCPPQILAFNLRTDQLIHRYRIPASQIKLGKALFVTPIVDVRDPPPGYCQNTMIYLADVEAFGLVVYDVSCGESWRVEHKFMQPIQKFVKHTISGDSFELNDGILGMTMSPLNKPPNDRLLYFHALSSDTENVVPLRILDNKKNWVLRPDSLPLSFTQIGSRGKQSAVEAMDRNGNIFFGVSNPNSIVCWDSSKPYHISNLKTLVRNDVTLQFASGLKVITNPYGKEELWVLTNRFQKYANGALRPDEVNFRILYLDIEELLGGTRCI